MRTSIWVMASAALLAGACTTTGSAPMKPVQPDDLAHCRQLVVQYTRYVGSVGGSLGGNTDGGASADLDTKVAIAQCQEGNTDPAIPVLERKLRDARVAVPPRPA